MDFYRKKAKDVPDGKIVFSTELDNKDLEKQLNQTAKKISSIEERIFKSKSERSPLVKQAEQLELSLERARQKLVSMQTTPSMAGKDAIREQQAAVRELQSEYNAVQRKVMAYDENISKATAELERQKDKAGDLTAQIAEANAHTNMMAPAIAKADKYMDRFTKRVKGLARRVFVFTVITTALRSMKNWMGSVVKTNDEATAAISKFKGALLTLAQPLVNVIIPAFTSFVNMLTRVVSAIASLISFLFGTTIEDSAEAAEKLNNEQEALDGVGAAAKSAGKSLASFDEINKLVGDSGGGGKSGTDIKPDFSDLKNGLLGNITFSIEDILFDWTDLTAEDILAKIITGLSALVGGVIGFILGGPGGALLGILIGAGIGVAISNILFNGDGSLDPEEILKTLLLALGAICGGIIGFMIGGPGGAAVGIAIGAGISLAIMKLLFDGDGQLSQEEILSSAIIALGTIAGGIIGFVLGGPGGAAIGAIIGAGVTLGISKLLFNGDGEISPEEIKAGIATALGALVGGIIGFAAGGPAGAAIGVLVGAGCTAKILSLSFEEGSGLSADKIIGGLVEVLVAILGGLIGFAVGGPLGAVIGATIGVGLSLVIDKAFFSDKSSKKAGYNEGKELGDNVLQGTEDSLGINSPSTKYQDVGDYMMKGMANGITNNSSVVVNAFSILLETLKTKHSDFMAYLMNEFATKWKNMWSDAYGEADRNIRLTMSSIDALNAKLASIERNIVITITTVYETVGSSSSGGSSSGSSSKTSSSRSTALSAVSVPAAPLATGAVIPPNREFLAVLGDQKSGTNIETPLSTMIQAFRTAMVSMGIGGGQNEASLILDDEVIGKIVYRLYNKEDRRVGVKLSES